MDISIDAKTSKFVNNNSKNSKVGTKLFANDNIKSK